MRLSATGLGLSPELEQLLRRGDPSAGPKLEAIRRTRQDVRQRKAQFNLADSLADVVVDDSAGVRLAETVSTLIQSLTHTTYFTDLDRAFPFFAATIEWAGADPVDIELKRVKAWLHPRRNAGAPKEVAKWRLDLYRLVRVGFPMGFPARRQYWLAPIVEPLLVDAIGDAEGLVTFDYSVAPIVERPRPKRYGPPAFGELLATLWNAAPAPVTVLIISALKADGAPAGNVGLAYDAGVASVVTGGNVLSSRKLEAPAAVPTLPGGGVFRQPGTHGDGGAAGGTPRITIESGTYVSGKLQFSTVGNRIDLGGVPTGDVVFTIAGGVPMGTALTGQVLKDGGNPVVDGDWVTFLSGQKSTDLVNVAKRQTYEIRGKLLTDASASLTPTLRKLAVEELTTSDMSDYAVLRLQGGHGIDAVTLTGEIVRGTIVGIRDGDRDYHSQIEDLVTAAKLGQYTFRTWVGATGLAKDKWLHLDDWLPEGETPRAGDLAIAVVSPLVLIRSLLPKYSPGSVVMPDGDAAVGAWTTLAGGGANLYQQLNELEAVQDDATGIRSELDPVNSVYKATLGAFTDPTARPHYVDYRFQKDAAAGKTIQLTVELRQAGVLISFQVHVDISDQITGGSFRLTDAQQAAISNYPALEIWVSALVGGAGGSRRAIVTWARARLGGRRTAIAYSNQSIKAVYDDLLVNQLEVDPQWLGPGLEDTTTLVSKLISEVGDEEEPTSKSEVESLAYLLGFGLLGSQGRVKAVDMTSPAPIVAYFPADEVRVLSFTPGIEDRIEEFVVVWNWNAARGDFDGEVFGASAAGVLAFGDAKMDGPIRADREICEWIIPQAGPDPGIVARRVCSRVIGQFGAGRIRALIETEYMHPELEPGDRIAFESDLFVACDPNTGARVAGPAWVIGRIELADDPEALGRRFTIAVQSWADIIAVTEDATRLSFGPVTPHILGVKAYGSDNGDIRAVITVNAGLSVRVVGSTVGMPSDAAVRAAALQPLDSTGHLTTGVLATINPGGTAYVKAFAYEKLDGSGLESLAGVNTIVLGIRPRRFIFDDGKFALLASDNIGSTADVGVKLVPQVGVYEGGVVQRLYRHREEISVLGADADGEVDVSFAQTYQNAPMILPRGGQYVAFSNTLPGGKQRLRIQAVNVTATGFRSRAQIASIGATTARDDDFPAADVLDAEGETSDADLTPGGANDDTYIVHYFTSVTANQEVAEPGSEVQVNLTLAIDINRQDGFGWIETATYIYNAIANDANPSVTNTWSHEQKPIVVTGLGTNDDIRIRAKTFSVVTIGGSSGTGSFIVRGGDNGATDAFHGVTYNTAADTVESAIPSTGDAVQWVAQEVT